MDRRILCDAPDLSFLGSFGNGLGLLRTPVDLILIALGSIAVFTGRNIRRCQRQSLIMMRKRRNRLSMKPRCMDCGVFTRFITVAEDL
ncbi:hypothetical protein PO124_14920 [Bacillus licheniformis]|nr:hypothetical protein [Bacillus licheniformis]